MKSEEQRWRVGSEVELLDLYDRSFDEVYRYAARLTRYDHEQAEDLVHEAFTRLVSAAQDDQIDDVGIGWLISTVRRRFIDRLRSRDHEHRRLRLVASSPASIDAPSILQTSIFDDLTERERAALIFRYVDDLPVRDVADLLDSSVRATESLLQRAKRKARTSEQTA